MSQTFTTPSPTTTSRSFGSTLTLVGQSAITNDLTDDVIREHYTRKRKRDEENLVRKHTTNKNDAVKRARHVCRRIPLLFEKDEKKRAIAGEKLLNEISKPEGSILSLPEEADNVRAFLFNNGTLSERFYDASDSDSWIDALQGRTTGQSQDEEVRRGKFTDSQKKIGDGDDRNEDPDDSSLRPDEKEYGGMDIDEPTGNDPFQPAQPPDGTAPRHVLDESTPQYKESNDMAFDEIEIDNKPRRKIEAWFPVGDNGAKLLIRENPSYRGHAVYQLRYVGKTGPAREKFEEYRAQPGSNQISIDRRPKNQLPNDFEVLGHATPKSGPEPDNGWRKEKTLLIKLSIITSGNKEVLYRFRSDLPARIVSAAKEKASMAEYPIIKRRLAGEKSRPKVLQTEAIGGTKQGGMETQVSGQVSGRLDDLETQQAHVQNQLEGQQTLLLQILNRLESISEKKE